MSAEWVDRLHRHLATMPPLAVAVSGGVDSLTLAAVAHRAAPDAWMLHAASAAVPREATERVRDAARRGGWALQVIDAAEFANPDYLANPVNRCFHCKSQLYGSIRQLTGRQIVSGANVDDLGEYRPGLDAARDHAVRHPYLELGIDKAGVRAIARTLGLGEVADLPAAPCLSSRIETGIAIEAPTLGFVHAVEQLVGAELAVRTVRCRVRASGVVVEIDAASLAALDAAAADRLSARIREHPGAPRWTRGTVRFEPYRNGSAFLHGRVAA